MSDADKLFEELGYEKEKFENEINEKIIYTDKGNEDIQIIFQVTYQLIKIVNYEGIGMQELKAINAKVKELRMG